MAGRALDIGEYGALVAAAIVRHRRRRGWEQSALATRVTEAGRPMSASVLGKVEASTRRVDVDDLVALATALEVSPSALLGLGDPAPAEDTPGTAGGPVETAARDDVEMLGELDQLDGMAPTLAEVAYRLARELDGGGEGGKALHSLARELRSTLAELRALLPEEAPDDDDLDDLGSPD